ncbi:hypothetical protein BLS_004873 [Venturia inaequalis]|uniref:Uncharacterized protein n=1 Tax=Venturia inaequalis TaxID=5025 RepID=A0A8H3UI91_VENIN|nr:hypothetical protein BLS_004873 [Venturia inaequalis]
MDSPNVQASGPSSSPCANIPESRIQSMPFMKLPAEIRNSIYRYCFVEDSQTPVNGVNTKFPGIGLLRANKQIHLESSGILYGNNTFTFGLDIDWLNKPEMILHGFPKTLPIWPAPRYHTLLQRLEIQIRFAAGLPTDLEAPEIMQNQIQAMRDAYDSVWDQLDIHFKFMEGDLADLTFTMAWLKFRMLEPISHADCSVETETQVSPVVRWALEATLQQKDLKATLSKEQLKALTESEEIANQVSEASVLDVATRLAHGTVRAPPGPPFTVQGGLSQNPFHQLLNQLASFNSVLNHPLAAFGGPPMVNPSPITPGPFGPSHMMPIMHPYMNGAVPASSLPGPGPWPPSLFGNGPGQSTPAPFANGTPASTLSTSGPVQPISTPYGNGPPKSLFTNGPGHRNPIIITIANRHIRHRDNSPVRRTYIIFRVDVLEAEAARR